MLFDFLGAGELLPELGGVFAFASDRRGIGLALRETGQAS